MDSVLQLTPKQRSELFIAAAQQSGIDVVVLEKDFWVCWTLKELFRLPTMGETFDFQRRHVVVESFQNHQVSRKARPPTSGATSAVRDSRSARPSFSAPLSVSLVFS